MRTEADDSVWRPGTGGWRDFHRNLRVRSPERLHSEGFYKDTGSYLGPEQMLVPLLPPSLRQSCHSFTAPSDCGPLARSNVLGPGSRPRGTGRAHQLYHPGLDTGSVEPMPRA